MAHIKPRGTKIQALLLTLLLALFAVPTFAFAAEGGDLGAQGLVSQDGETSIKDYYLSGDTDWGYTGEDLSERMAAAVTVAESNAKGAATLKLGDDYTVSFKNAEGASDATPKDVGSYTMVIEGAGTYAGTLTQTVNVVPYFTVYEQVGANEPVKVYTFDTKEDFEKLKRAADTEPVSAIYFKNGLNVDTATEYVRLDDIIEKAGLANDWVDGASVKYGGDARQDKTSNEFTKAQLAETKFFPKATATTTSEEGAVGSPFVFALKEMAGVASDTQTAQDVADSNASKANENGAPRAMLGSLVSEYQAQSGTTVAGKRLWNNVTNITIKVPSVDISAFKSQLKKFDTDWGYSGSDLQNINANISLTADEDGDIKLAENTDYTVSFKRTADADGKAVEEDATSYAKELGAYAMTIAGTGKYSGKIEVAVNVVPYFTVYKQVGTASPEKVYTFNTKAEFEALKRSSDTDSVSSIYYKSGLNVSTATEYVRLEDVIDKAGLTSDWTDDAVVNYGGDARQGKASNDFTKAQLAQTKFFPKATAKTTSTEDAVDSPFVFALKEKTGKASGEQTAQEVATANASDANSNTAPRAMLGSLESEYREQNGTTVAGKRLWNNVTNITIKVPATDVSDDSTVTVTLDQASHAFTGKAIEPAVTVKKGDAVLTEDADYTVEYANNTNVTASATATITFTGAYTGTKTATFAITAIAPTITASARSVAMGKAVAIGAKVNSGGKLTYVSSNTAVAKVDKTTGKVTPVKVGAANITVTAAANGNYKAGKKTIKVTVTKGANTLTAKGATVSIKVGKSVKVAKGITVKSAKGTVSYAKKSGNKKITVKNGKITVKKGLKKGAYTIKVNVTAKGNANWNAKTVKNVSVKVKVK